MLCRQEWKRRSASTLEPEGKIGAEYCPAEFVRQPGTYLLQQGGVGIRARAVRQNQRLATCFRSRAVKPRVHQIRFNRHCDHPLTIVVNERPKPSAMKADSVPKVIPRFHLAQGTSTL